MIKICWDLQCGILQNMSNDFKQTLRTNIENFQHKMFWLVGTFEYTKKEKIEKERQRNATRGIALSLFVVLPT